MRLDHLFFFRAMFVHALALGHFQVFPIELDQRLLRLTPQVLD